MITKQAAAARVIPGQTVSDTLQANGRRIVAGTEVTVDGIRGRCAFVSHTVRATGVEWVDLVTSRGQRRTVRPDRIKRVHRGKTGIRA